MKSMIRAEFPPSRINWRMVLEDYLSNYQPHYSYMRPDKRFHEASFLLPGYQRIAGDTLSNILIAVDASGSVDDNMLGKMLSEIVNIARKVGAMDGKILFFDHNVYPPVPFDQVDVLRELHRPGYGGTDFLNVFEHIAAMNEDAPTLILFVTDGYDAIPDEGVANGVPVVWLVYSDVRPEWGTVINIEDE